MNITENIGKLILSTQSGIKQLKEQLDFFSKNNINDERQKDVQILHDRLLMQIEVFESKLDGKMDYLYKNIINDNNITVQKLPSLKYKDNNSGTLLIKEKRNDEKQILQTKNMPIDLVQKPLSKIVYTKKKDYFGKKYKNLNLSKAKTTDEIPFFSESLLSQGLSTLINKGVIKKEMNLDQYLSKIDPPFTNKSIQFQSHKEKFIKRDIQVFSDQSNFNFDINNLPISKPIPSKSFIQRQKSEITYLLPKVFNEKKLIENNLQLSFQKKTQSSDYQQRFSKFDFKSDPLTYPEVLDTYSLHHFIIRKGKTLSETPEFQSYKRICEKIWEPIERIIKELEKLIKDNNIFLINVDGKKVARLAVEKRFHSTDELLDCVVNQDELQKKLKIPKRLYKGIDGKEKSCVKIQSLWRMYINLRDYKRIKVLIEKVKIIQKGFRSFQNFKKTKELIKEKNQREFEIYLEKMENFKKNWNTIKLKKRVEIHINSCSFEEIKRLTMEKFIQRQNNQIARIFNLRDPFTEIIYISPFDFSPEIINYYHKVLELGELSNYKERLHFIWPENHIRFPSHFSASRLLLYSAKSLKRIKNLIKGKEAYLIPGYPSNDDIKLANLLNVPMLSGEPQNHLVYSTKSASKRLFLSCDIPCPPGAYEIYDEKEFINSLTILISNNLTINTWVFKIDDEFSGRGIASLSTNKIKFFKEFKKKKAKGQIFEEDLNIIRTALKDILQKKIKISTPSLYKNYKEFIKAFTKKGGIIEAVPNTLLSSVMSPSISFLIEPDGKVNFLCSYDKIQSKEFINSACSFPQESLQEINLKAIIDTIGEQLYKKGVFGYCTIDLIGFPDPINDFKNNILFWAIGLDCFLNQYSVGYFYFDFLMKGKVEDIHGSYTIMKEIRNEVSGDIEESNSKRRFLFCPFLYHPGLSNIQYKTFFHMSRIENISFDLERKIGSSFLLMDSLQTGVVSLISIAESDIEVFRFFKEALNFISSHCGNLGLKYNDLNDISRTDNINISDLISTIRLKHKRKEKENIKKEKILNPFFQN